MAGERVERRLAAVLAADVAEYSRLMGADEEGTLAQLKSVRKTLVDPVIAAHRGRIVKTTGDGMLVEFASAVDAARCAVEVQRSVDGQNATVPQDQKIEFRIGIHVGDIIIDDNDIFGDGVNIAARLEGIAVPGGICISDDAQRQIRGKVDIAFEDMGPQKLKNIVEPMRAWRVQPGDPSAAKGPPGQAPALALPDKPSIAVLPFQNLSGDPEQDYFADGMVEDIITALSRFKSLFVIARNSSFTYKGRAIDIKRVGRELGVRYVLEGSVRKAAGIIRISGQLINAATGTHLWADRFDGNLDDVFALQDKITEAVVSAIAPTVYQAEIDLAARRRPVNLSAYDLGLRASQLFSSMTREGNAEAIELCHRALALDPRYGFAAFIAGSCHFVSITQGWAPDPTRATEEARRLLSLALAIDENDPDVLATVGLGMSYLAEDTNAATEMVDRAVALNPNSAVAWSQRGLAYLLGGQCPEAVRSFERSIRLNPLDPLLYMTLSGMGFALIELRRFDEAVAAAKKAIRQNPNYVTSFYCLASALGHAGPEAEAQKAVSRLLELEPDFRLSKWVKRGASQWHTRNKLVIEGIRKAGIPE
ncbi:adenylate/guanylate cyclase domain-containing protein [Bradyrhizobium sp. AUGA SZCCT0283]|uniref:adenylate/guanylate cyclase domain-containing protein n=1 Tax=Bradyrhizobium sp. AUGA SZCCT0283 TaxID=2807671 RepID=UPI001BA447F7|nr:adenylate/guanylate cyclase domain-containing protein [Bradyrhizobium sp. AUGA SZCCT0283]MBR1280182.1 adenylate/guanylate cyclase domain-containing protein [Bradyrhizobium sp. AUGA SZCCT0283]